MSGAATRQRWRDVSEADPEIKVEVPDDIEHKFGKPGTKVKTFTLLDNPDEYGMYHLVQVTIKDGKKVYTPLNEIQFTTSEAVDAYVAENGQWDA